MRLHSIGLLLCLSSAFMSTSGQEQPNLLFIVSDQFRSDALRFVQDQLWWYDEHAKISTPNLDKLAAGGVAFLNAYCQLPSCAPSRTSLFTGCTIERSGVQGNNLVVSQVAARMPELFADKIDKLVSFEQLLVQEKGYTAENYGKWHVPYRLYDRLDGNGRAIQYNSYDFVNKQPSFDEGTTTQLFKQWFKWTKDLEDLKKPRLEDGQLDGTVVRWPYTPIKFDDRYGESAGGRIHSDGVRGWGALDQNYTQTYYQGLLVRKALRRLAEAGGPFSVVLNLSSPHPPMETSNRYAAYYQGLTENLFVPPSNVGEPKDSPYAGDVRSGYANKPEEVQEWTAVYYALVQEVDDAIGEIINELEILGLKNNTMIVFTADHGEFLGAHGFESKSKLYEEAVHVPLIMSFPGRIPEGVSIRSPVSHLDVFSTVLDYMDASDLDGSDGSSLRPLIDDRLYNGQSMERVVVSELDDRVPVGDDRLTKRLGFELNFMIRNGDYKLMVPKLASSELPDMMFDLATDPFEMNNLLSEDAPDWVIGKAEQLKIELVDWMEEKDGADGYYSSAKWNLDQGDGDIQEVTNRRTWKRLDYWQSDRDLGFGEATLDPDGKYVRQEYLYVGRTTPGSLSVTINIVGEDSQLFTWGPKEATIEKNDHVRIWIRYESETSRSMSEVQAAIEIISNVTTSQLIPIVSSPY